jgi:hypothetical protein
MNKFKVLFFTFISITSLYSQEIEPKKWKVIFQLDNRFSSIRKNDITVFGAKVGFQYKNLTRFGIGTSFILNPVTIDYFNKRTATDETNKINFWYISLFNDWILYKNQHWECFITEQIGFGKPSFVKEVNDEIVKDVNVNLFINEISGQINYKVKLWIGIGAGFGYRNDLNKSQLLQSTFNAPIYIGKIIIYPEAIFKR